MIGGPASKSGHWARAGQGTVEYALVTAAVLVIIVALGALVDAVGEGGITQGVLDSLTHRMPGGVFDLVLF